MMFWMAYGSASAGSSASGLAACVVAIWPPTEFARQGGRCFLIKRRSAHSRGSSRVALETSALGTQVLRSCRTQAACSLASSSCESEVFKILPPVPCKLFQYLSLSGSLSYRRGCDSRWTKNKLVFLETGIVVLDFHPRSRVLVS